MRTTAFYKMCLNPTSDIIIIILNVSVIKSLQVITDIKTQTYLWKFVRKIIFIKYNNILSDLRIKSLK